MANGTTRNVVITGPYISSQIDQQASIIFVYDSKETCNQIEVHQFDKIVYAKTERDVDED